jgi:hypothetical protein
MESGFSQGILMVQPKVVLFYKAKRQANEEQVNLTHAIPDD